jgi:hypothetical protein
VRREPSLVLAFTVSQHHRIAFPASTRQKGNVGFGRFFAIRARAFGPYLEQLLMGYASVFSHVGLRANDSIRGSTDCDSICWGLRAVFSRQPIALDAGGTGLSYTQRELRYENGRQHDGDGARLRKLLSERIGF